MRHEDLCDLIAARELDHSFGDIAASQNPCFNLQSPSEAQVLLDSLSFLNWQLGKFRSLVHEKRRAIGTKVVGHAAPSTD
jgi:hypothetical protein